MKKRFDVIKSGTLFYVSDTLTLKPTGKGPFDVEVDCQNCAEEMNAVWEALEGSTMTNETTASQPKSIWDDAQFQNAFYDYRRFGNDEFLSKLVEVIDNWADSRAPAAQASATIQAAPDDMPSTMEDARKLIQYLRIEIDSKVMELYDIKKKLAATIQEPVMVAEPVRDIRVLRRWATQIDRMASTFIDERSLLCQQAAILLYRIAYLPDAAPMVADPAGVVCGTCDAIGSHRHGCPLAATVKAVPSEALELAGMVVKATFGDHKILVPRVDLSGKGIGTLVYFAAPLADKTGGGE